MAAQRESPSTARSAYSCRVFFGVCVQYESVRVCVLSERYGRMCSVMEWQLTTGGLPGVELAACGEIVERRTDHGHGETVCGSLSNKIE